MVSTIFLDTNVVIAASIDGYLELVDLKVQHIHYGPAKQFMDRVEALVGLGDNRTAISFQAENEARRVIVKAVTDAVSKCWETRKSSPSPEERLKLASTLDVFRRLCDANLNKNLALLAREPVKPEAFNQKLAIVNQMFSQLDQAFERELDQDAFVQATSPRWRNLRDKIAVDQRHATTSSYKPNPYFLDKEILASASALHAQYFCSFDKNFVSEWSRKAIRETLGIQTMQPQEMTSILDNAIKSHQKHL